MANIPLPSFVVQQAKVQGVTAVALGVAFIIAPGFAYSNPIADLIIALFGMNPPKYTSSPMEEQLATLCGVFCIAIGSAYGLAFAHGYDEWLAISVPVRIVVAVVGLMVWLLTPGKLSPLLVGVIVWDGSAAMVGAWLMGSFTGKRPRRVKKT